MTEQRFNKNKINALIAQHWFNWTWEQKNNNYFILVPPVEDERRSWAAMWDNDGLPHWLPDYIETMKESRIELVEDPVIKGRLDYISDKGLYITWDTYAPDGGSRYTGYTDIEGAIPLIRPETT